MATTINGSGGNKKEAWEDDELLDGESSTAPGEGKQLMDLLNSQLLASVKTQEKYDGLLKRFDLLRKAKENADSQNAALAKRLEEVTARSNELDNNLIRERAEASRLTASLHELTGSKEAVVQEKSRTEEQLKKVTHEKDALKDDLAALNIRNKELEVKHSEHVKLAAAEKQHLEARLEAVLVKAQEASKHAKHVSEELGRERSARIEAQKALEIIGVEVDQKDKQVADLASQARSLQQKSLEQQRTKADLRQALDAGKALEAHNQELRRLLEEEKAKSSQLWNALEEIKQLREFITQQLATGPRGSTTELEELRRENKKLKKESDTATQKLEAVLENVNTHLMPPTKEKDARRITAGKRSRKSAMSPRPRVGGASAPSSLARNPHGSLPTSPVSSRSSTPLARSYTPSALKSSSGGTGGDLLLIDFLENMRSPGPDAKKGENRRVGGTPKKLNFDDEKP